MSLAETLNGLIRIAGVRGAMVVSREDGLVVAEALMDSLDGGAVAALAASFIERTTGITTALGQPEGKLVQLAGSEGVLLIAPAGAGLLLVAIAAGEVNAGELRLGLLAAAERAA